MVKIKPTKSSSLQIELLFWSGVIIICILKKLRLNHENRKFIWRSPNEF